MTTQTPIPNQPETPEKYRRWVYWRNEFQHYCQAYMDNPNESQEETLRQLMADYRRDHHNGMVKSPLFERY